MVQKALKSDGWALQWASQESRSGIGAWDGGSRSAKRGGFPWFYQNLGPLQRENHDTKAVET